MTTLNILAIKCATDDPEVVDEAVSVLRWAAEAGPMGIELSSMQVDAADPLPESVQDRARRADAILLGSTTLPGMTGPLTALRHSLGTYAVIRHLPTTGPQPTIMVQANSDASPIALRRAVDNAFQIAERRGVALTYAASPAPARERAWHEAVAEIAPRFPKVSVHARPPNSKMRQLQLRPESPEVIATDLDLAPGSTGSAVPWAWLGRYGSLFALAPAREVTTRLTAAMQAAAMLLEHGAARFGLAESIRRATDEVLPGAPPAPVGQMGQAVLDNLDACFEPCAGW
ncbi:MAG: hypothetical protein AAGF11_12965 [Myxococcota bacterium]